MALNRFIPQIKAEKLVPILFKNIPNIILYCVCFGYFFINTSTLITQFLRYETTVLVKFEAKNQVKFPGFTICGCSIGRVLCNSSESVVKNELNAFYHLPIGTLLDNISFSEVDIVGSCIYVFDSRRPDNNKPCSAMEKVVHSLQDGRKCITYLSMLHDGPKLSQKDIRKNITENFGNTSYIKMEINFGEAVGMKQKDLITAIQDANVIMAIHPAEILPTFLDMEFLKLEPNMKYEMHFGKRETHLERPPYDTNCKDYDKEIKPRSQNECVHLCMIEKSYKRNHRQCINYYNLVTKSWLHHLSDLFDPTLVRYCGSRDDRNYTNYIQTRRDCYDECKQRDCKVEYYQHVVETSQINQLYSYNSNKSVVEIWPDRKLYEVVQHYPELNIFELIGCLGGHAHIFLGLSAIQLYDVVISAIGRVRRFYQKVV